MTETIRKTKRTDHFMDSSYLKKQLIGEVQEAIRVKELNIELLEHLSYTTRWILMHCEKNNIKPPDLDKLVSLIHRSRQLIDTMYEPYSYRSDDILQGDDTSKDPTKSGQDRF
jgi:hypothetical protein